MSGAADQNLTSDQQEEANKLELFGGYDPYSAAQMVLNGAPTANSAIPAPAATPAPATPAAPTGILPANPVMTNPSAGASGSYPTPAPTAQPGITPYPSAGGQQSFAPSNPGMSFQQALGGGSGSKGGQGGGMPQMPPGMPTGMPAQASAPSVSTGSPLASILGGQTSGGG